MDDILRKANRFAKKGEYQKAGNLLEIAGDLENAAKMYLKAGSLSQAAKLYESIHFNIKAAELYARNDNFLKAAELYKLDLNYAKAAEMYKQAGNFFYAAEMYKKDKKYPQAAKNYEDSDMYEAAGDMYKLSENFLKAAQVYQRGYNELLRKKEDEILLTEREVALKRIAGKAADSYLAASREEDAAVFFEKAANWRKSGELFEKIGSIDKAVEMYFQGRDFSNGLRLIELSDTGVLNLASYARILNEEGHPRESAVLYEKAQKYEDAGYQYQQAGLFNEAAENFRRAEIFPIAAECYLEESRYSDAAEMYERAKRYRNAAEMYIRSGNMPKALEQYIMGRDFLIAAELAEKMDMSDKAVKLLKAVSPESGDYIEASFRLGKLLFEQQEYDKALKQFQIIAHDDEYNPNRTETFYYLGRIWEDKQIIENARESYQQVIKYDLEFRDARMRLEHLEELRKEIEEQRTKVMAVENEADKDDSSVITNFLRRRYQLEEVIGQGVLGKVYRAKDVLLERTVVIKEIEKKRFLSPLVMTRFKRKIMATARLNHPNIVMIYDLGEDEQHFLIAREYVEGINLASLLERNKIALHKALNILTQCLWAIDSAHKNKVIHRNLCPENILITRDNTVKISDFGLYFRTSELQTDFEQEMVKKHIYLSLNTINGEPESPRDDLISIAQIMIQLISGKLEHAPDIQELNPEWEGSHRIPDRFKSVLSRIYSSDDQNRVHNANEFADLLKSDALGPGSLFDGRYEIIEKMGRGGMGAVFKAHDRVLKELVAIKALRESALLDERNLKRFKWEIKAARKISHPNVVRIHHLGYCEGTYYISMELIYGITLKEQIIEGKALPVRDKISIIMQIVDALGAVHALDIIHRDVKPQNILIDKDLNVKIVDFGIARVGNLEGLTDTGEVMGTPEYMAPEQIRKKIDFRSDIYSLGIVIYEFLTGKLPFTGDTPIGVLMAHLKTQPPFPRSIKPELDPELEQIVLKCLEKSPDSRYQTMAELAVDLKQYYQTLDLSDNHQ
ncbi:protein kinase [bacterium]|nr:protein kinase [bacterium]